MGYPGGTLNVGPNGEDEINVYRTIHEAGDSLSLPIMQEIDIAKDDEGQMTVTTARNHFDVVASDSLVYGLELRYYDQNGLLIKSPVLQITIRPTNKAIKCPTKSAVRSKCTNISLASVTAPSTKMPL